MAKHDDVMNIHDELPPRVDNQTSVSLDTEFFGQIKGRLHRPHGTFACMQIGIDEDVYMVYDTEQIQPALNRIKNAKVICGHNLLYDFRQLRRFVPINRRYVWDSLIVEKLLYGGFYGNGEFSLSDLVRRYLDIVMDKSVRNQFITATSMTPELRHYAALDAYLTLQVMRKQEEVTAERGYDMRTYNEIDEPYLWATLDFLPIKVRVKRWLEMAEEFELLGRSIEAELNVNVYSHVDVKDVIQHKLRKTIKNTRAETLQNLDHPFVDRILEARMYRKAASTYGKNWVKNFVEEDDLVYPDFCVTGASSGRVSCARPNLLQIPARRMPEYRELFISRLGKLIVADVQAQEPRILSYISKDKNLRAIFDNKQDVHLEVAHAAFNDDTFDADDPRRNIGKVINLATSYGMTARGLADKLHISERDAEDFFRGYFSRFPNVKNYIDRQRYIAMRQGYVESVSGRRIYVNSHSYQSENVAINAPIQSSGADFVKMWTNRMWQRCNDEGLPFPVIGQVYDELVLDSSKENVSAYKKMLKETANEVAGTLFGDTPWEIETHVGKSWACKKLEDDIEEMEE